MASVVTRKIPEIVLVDKEQLGAKELFTLNMLHKTDVSEFVICPHQRETIYLNKSFERAEDLIPIINGFMEQEWCNSKGDKLYKQFVFDVGYGLYDKKRLADFQNGAECTFMYGYLCALEDQEKQQSVAE